LDFRVEWCWFYNLLEGERYRTVACLKDENNRIIDKQMVFVIVELEKFDKIPENCTTDLDKLIFTMKEAHKMASAMEQPAFMKEDWIVAALHELDTRALSPERRASLSIFLAKELSERHNQAEMAAQVESGKQELAEIKEMLQAHQKEIQAHQKEIQAHQKEIQAHQKEIQAHQKEIEANQKEIEARDQEIEARDKALELGKAKELNFKRTTIRTMMTVTDWTDEQIALKLNLPLDLVQQVRAEK
jgi:chromosome segregation ATPase